MESISLSRDSGYATPLKANPEVEEGLHLYVDNLCVLDLPDEGTISFRYKKGPVSATEASDSRPARASADLVLTEICGYEACKEEAPESDEESTDSIDKLFAAISKKPDADDEVE